MEKGTQHRALRLIAAAAVLLGVLAAAPSAEAACAAPANEVEAENCRPGNPAGEWEVSGAGDPSIQGFATDISVPQGGTAQFKVDTTATDYRLDIYRMGYYGGDGARRVDTVQPTAVQDQPDCDEQAATGLIDCGNWAPSASWPVPADAVSGIYFARLVRESGAAGASHVVFVVRDDDGASDLLFQTSDTTWQAYNNYGGNSLYVGSPVGRAYKVSYNRPFSTRGNASEDWLFNAEYPMVRWLERNGYDVSYTTGADSDRRGAELLEHDAFLSVGHDEYWSGAQRANVEIARNAGVDLAFFSGNEVFWKTRWENNHRTLVGYKETHANAEIDSDPTWTGTWRDPRPFNAEGPRPENALTGTLFTVNSGTTALRVPAADGGLRFWRNSPVAMQSPVGVAELTDGTIGYEWDEDIDNGARPAGLVRLSSTTTSVDQKLLDYGSTYGPGTATHHLTLYRDTNDGGPDALVFGAGTVQWSWGLDADHDRGSAPADRSMQQATLNLFADMGVQPASRQADLAAAGPSTDTVAPAVTITSPASGSRLERATPVVVQGTAADAGGRVGAVEVSVDDGATWHPATGRDTWSYTWTPAASGAITVYARAADDSGNLSAPSAGVTVTVGGRTCPCSLFGDRLPADQDGNDAEPIEVGVRFRSDQAGTITALRFFKGANWQAGTRVGHLWRANGERLAEVQFTETASGWQQATLATPVRVEPDTVYVASYFSPTGDYAADADFFTTGYDAPPLHAPAGQNGVYVYGGGFPTEPFRDTNYWADVVFVPDDSTPPVVTAVSPADGSTGVAAGSQVSATFSEPLRAASVTGSTMQLRTAAGASVPAAVGYAPATRTATLTPAAPLAAGAVYTAIVQGVEDAAGNPLAPARTWTFTVGPVPASGPRPGGEPFDRPSGGVAGDRAKPTAPRVRVRPRRARVSRAGVVRLRLTCPGTERCRVALRLRLAGRDAAKRSATLRAGRTRMLELKLRRTAFRTLVRRGSLRVTAVAVTTGPAGARATTRTRIRLVAPHAMGAA